MRLMAVCLIALYISFALLFFLFCYISGWVPLFAVSPILVFILVGLTWPRFFPDCYFEFGQGMLTLGYERRRGKKRREKVKIHIRDAEKIFPHSEGRVKLSGVKRIYDMSSSARAKERVCILYFGCAYVFDTTPTLSRLLVSYAADGCADELEKHLKANKTLHKGE